MRLTVKVRIVKTLPRAHFWKKQERGHVLDLEPKSASISEPNVKILYRNVQACSQYPLHDEQRIDADNNNINTNSVPEDVTTGSSRHSEAARTMASHQTGGRTPSLTTSGGGFIPRRIPAKTFVVYFLQLILDILTFFVRGGLSAMMFFMDQVLRVVLLPVETVLGSTGYLMIGYPLRMGMWLYQVLLWVVYTMTEIIFYLPWKVLLLYIIILGILMMVLPPFVLDGVAGLFKTLHWFIKIYQSIYSLTE